MKQKRNISTRFYGHDLDQVVDNQCVIKAHSSGSKHRVHFNNFAPSKVSLNFTIILILRTMNNIFHILTYHI